MAMEIVKEEVYVGGDGVAGGGGAGVATQGGDGEVAVQALALAEGEMEVGGSRWEPRGAECCRGWGE